jgi:hypothetical protein
MASTSNIAKKARSKAEADFATWLMMAKLGSFDDLPPNAQSFLTNYRVRLEMMSEAESTVLAVREVYVAYYTEMGGVGTAPEPQARKPTTEGNVARVRRQSKGSVRSIGCAQGDRANDRKVPPGPVDFREHGSSDRHI